jgi:hypothetical protein
VGDGQRLALTDLAGEIRLVRNCPLGSRKLQLFADLIRRVDRMPTPWHEKSEYRLLLLRSVGRETETGVGDGFLGRLTTMQLQRPLPSALKHASRTVSMPDRSPGLCDQNRTDWDGGRQ